MTHSPDHLEKTKEAFYHNVGHPEHFSDSTFDYVDALQQRIELIEEAVKVEINDGFGPYMKNIQRALQGKPPKRKQIRK